MVIRPSVLSAVDFSESSRGALRFAAAIAEHFYAGLTVVSVDDPLLSGAAGMVYGETAAAMAQQELEQFVKDTFRRRRPILAELQFEIAIGKPAIEIQRIAQARGSHLIVMSSHGRTGMSKLFFGSTTERVLRETNVPVLVTPADDPGPEDLEDLRRGINGVLAPVDFTNASPHQIRIAAGVANALSTPLVLVHVLEPLWIYRGLEAVSKDLHDKRRSRATDALAALLPSDLSPHPPEAVLLEGDPASEIARLARDRNIGAIVMGLHSTSVLGPRMGSVTYRVLCQTQTPVLALPPVEAEVRERKFESEPANAAVSAGRRRPAWEPAIA